MAFFPLSTTEQVARMMEALYKIAPLTLAGEILLGIAVLLILSALLALLAGASAWAKRRAPAAEIAEKLIDHLRQASLNAGIALLAVITATFVLVQQQRTQTLNHKLERLQVIEADLVTKLDGTLAGIGRLYFTQSVLVGLDALPSNRKLNDLEALQSLGTIANNFLSGDRVPPIIPSELPILSGTFSLKAGVNSPFLYAYLAPASAAAISVHERHLAIGLAALTSELAAAGVLQGWAGGGAIALDLSKLSPAELKRRHGISILIEDLKIHAVSLGSFICEYRARVTQDLSRQYGPIFEGEQYTIPLGRELRSSAFLSSNRERLASKIDGRPCAEHVLRSIMLSYNSVIAMSGLFDFLDDLDGLRDREDSVQQKLNEMNAAIGSARVGTK